MDFIDFQEMAAANTARQAFGISSIRQSKAKEMAARLNKDIPDANVRGFHADSLIWP
jgi:hypothetical protein